MSGRLSRPKQAVIDSPIGRLLVRIDGGFVNKIVETDLALTSEADYGSLIAVISEIRRYFTGELTEFTFPVLYEGTEFQKKVWNACAGISYGATMTYGDIASMIGSQGAARAVGQAIGRNQILLAVPCHRVVASGGRLGGFRLGAGAKRILLGLENEKSLY